MKVMRAICRSAPVARLVAALAGLCVVGTAVSADADSAAWVWPLQPQPQVVQPFEPPAGPYAPGHRGVDLAGSVGQQVLAVADGVVTFAGRVAGMGVVVIDHGNERSTYQPVSASVQRRDTVGAGDVIGRLQLGGSHCWPDACLHLGRVAEETYLDPMELLGGGPVRLLPLSAPLPDTWPGRSINRPLVRLAAAGVAVGLGR